MILKVLEVRDKHTFIPVFALKTEAANPEQRYLLRRVGFSGDGYAVILGYLSGERNSSADPYHWGGRTMPAAHMYITDNFDELRDGDVVDVEFILGESTTKKLSERVSV